MCGRIANRLKKSRGLAGARVVADRFEIGVALPIADHGFYCRHSSPLGVPEPWHAVSYVFFGGPTPTPAHWDVLRGCSAGGRRLTSSSTAWTSSCVDIGIDSSRRRRRRRRCGDSPRSAGTTPGILLASWRSHHSRQAEHCLSLPGSAGVSQQAEQRPAAFAIDRFRPLEMARRRPARFAACSPTGREGLQPQRRKRETRAPHCVAIAHSSYGDVRKTLHLCKKNPTKPRLTGDSKRG